MKQKSNKTPFIDVRHRGELPWRYPRNWINNIKTKRTNHKNIRQRAIYGTCVSDAWALDEIYLSFFVNSLVNLRDHTDAFPADMESLDEWKAYLTEIIECFKFAQDDPYDCIDHEQYDTVMKHREIQRSETPNGTMYAYPSYTDEERIIIQKYFDDLSNYTTQQEESIQKGLQMLGKHFSDLWW